jgi:hypothetical protein
LLDDVLTQIAYEIYVVPDSCFAKDVTRWYNALYSALSDFTDCRHRESEGIPCNDDSVAEAIEGCELSDIENGIIDYLSTEFAKFPRNRGLRELNQFVRDVRRAYRLKR